jgi:hypothetical protein
VKFLCYAFLKSLRWILGLIKFLYQKSRTNQQKKTKNLNSKSFITSINSYTPNSPSYIDTYDTRTFTICHVAHFPIHDTIIIALLPFFLHSICDMLSIRQKSLCIECRLDCRQYKVYFATANWMILYLTC